MKRSEVQDKLLDAFEAAEGRRQRSRSDKTKALAVSAKQAIASLHVDLFGTSIEESDQERSAKR